MKIPFLISMILISLTLGLATNAEAKKVKVPDFQGVDAAKKAAAKESLPVIIVAGATVPKAATNPRDSIKKLIQKDETVRSRAEKFTWAFVEAYSPSDCQNGNYCISPAVKKKYGKPLAISLWTPTGATYMWNYEISEQTFTNNDPTPKAEAFAKMLDVALKVWTDWQATLNVLLKSAEADKPSDKKLKTIEHQLGLAAYYKAGVMVDEAIAAYQLAGKLAKKAAKKDPALAAKEIECAELACEIYTHAKLWEQAHDAYLAFAKKFRKSDQAIEAPFKAAICLNQAGKKTQALKELKGILKKKALAPIHEKSKALAETISAEIKSGISG